MCDRFCQFQNIQPAGWSKVFSTKYLISVDYWMAQIDFNLWKWRALHGRRLFFFCVLQVVLVFSWLTIRRIVHRNQSWTDTSTASTGYREFFEDVPILFYISHALLLLTVLFTNVGRNLVHESQGKRLCDLSAFSLLLALVFLLQPLNSIEEKALNDTRSTTFSVLSLFGMSLFQHLGTSEPVLTITMTSIIILWAIFLSFQGVFVASVVTIVFVVVAFLVLSRMQEYEFHRAYIKQKDSLQGSSYSATAYENIVYDSVLTSHGPGALGSSFVGNLAVFMEDTMTALKAMEYAIAQQEDMLNRDDLLMECEVKVVPTLTNHHHLHSNNNDNSNEDENVLAPASAAGKDQEVVSWKLTTHAASLQINKLLCQSLYFAVSNSDEFARMPGTSFSFNRICNQMFALFEGVRGNSLTLYANETVSEVLIIAPKSMFELIIFLLLHDAVHSDDRRICCLSCETSAAYGWHVSIQSITLEKSPYRTNSALAGGHQYLAESNGSTHSGSSGDNYAAKASAGPSGSGLRGASGEGFHFGKGLMLNENVTSHNRPMERLAERLTLKYLKSSIQYIDPEYRAGVRVDQKIIPLSSDRCMLAPTHDSLTFAMAQQQQQQQLSARHAPNGGNGGGEDSGALPLQRMGQDNLQWLFVVQRIHDLEGMGEIRDKMKNLCVPFRIKALSELRDPANSHSPLQYSVMVIDEVFLSKLLKDKDKSKYRFLRGVPLKWVVVTDPKKLSTATDIKVLYGIDAESLSSKASMPELFDCVQIVTHKLAPRTSPDVMSSFSDYDDYDAQRFRPQASSHPLFGLPYRRAARAADRSDAEAVKRWLFLVRQFKAVASKLYANDSQLLNGLDARMKDIEDLRDVTDNMETLLSVPGYQGPLADMNSHKKKAKYIMDTYQPHLSKLNTKLETFDLMGIHNLAAKCAVQSSTLGLLRLSCWFTTVQEIVSITMTIMDTKDYLRGGPDGDKSVSISFTSVGKALASRSHGAHPHRDSKGMGAGAGAVGSVSGTHDNSLKLDRHGNSATIPLSSSNSSINLRDSGTNLLANDSTRADDHMTLDDVSDGESGAGTEEVAVVKPKTNNSSSVAKTAEAPHGAVTTPHPSFGAAAAVGANNIISPQAKVIDAGLRAIIADMVRGIEVAVWDAAMER